MLNYKPCLYCNYIVEIYSWRHRLLHKGFFHFSLFPSLFPFLSPLSLSWCPITPWCGGVSPQTPLPNPLYVLSIHHGGREDNSSRPLMVPNLFWNFCAISSVSLFTPIALSLSLHFSSMKFSSQTDRRLLLFRSLFKNSWDIMCSYYNTMTPQECG